MELGNLLFGNSRGEYPVDRTWQNEFCEFLEACNLERGFYDGDDQFSIESGGFENDTFLVNPYNYSAECTCGYDDSVSDAEHSQDCKFTQPNFLYKPTGFIIKWYKYPLRDSYMNQEITLDELRQIITECIVSYNKK